MSRHRFQKSGRPLIPSRVSGKRGERIHPAALDRDPVGPQVTFLKNMHPHIPISCGLDGRLVDRPGITEKNHIGETMLLEKGIVKPEQFLPPAAKFHG
jgi:hypothetical protein